MALPRLQIDILGAGSVGCFLAHSLKCLPSPPGITLLVRPPQVRSTASRNGVSDHSSNFSISLTHGTTEKPVFSPPCIFSTLYPPLPKSHAPLTNLIVTTKAHQTLPALRPLLPFINKSTTILFLQNGMGVINEVQHELRKQLGARPLPRLLSGIVVHGIRQKPTGSRCEIELDTTDSLGYIEIGFDWNAAEYSFLSTLMSAPLLNVRAIPSRRFRLNQLYKLASNAVINPLTALYGIKNGELLDPHYESEIGTIIEEISAVLQKIWDEANELWQPSALKEEILRVARVTEGNTSSMLADVRAGRETEILYINGWIARKGRELGIECPMNTELVERVKALHIRPAE